VKRIKPESRKEDNMDSKKMKSEDSVATSRVNQDSNLPPLEDSPILKSEKEETKEFDEDEFWAEVAEDLDK
jgi:hypothetical protein